MTVDLNAIVEAQMKLRERVNAAAEAMFIEYGNAAVDRISSDRFHALCDEHDIEAGDLEDAIREAYIPDDWDEMHGH